MNRIGLGAMMFGWKTPPKDVGRIIDQCLTLGINVIDTSPSYSKGESENIIGTTLGQTNRNRMKLATKFSLLDVEKKYLDRVVRSSLEESLYRLKTDRVDFYTLHNDSNFPAIASLASIICCLKNEGLVGEFHISNFSIKSVSELLSIPKLLDAVDGIHVRHNLLFCDDPLWQVAVAKNVRTIAYSPLCEGLLTGKYRSSGKTNQAGGRLVEATKYRDYYDGLLSSKMSIKVAKIATEAKGLGLNLNHYAYRFVLKCSDIDTMLLGVSSLAQFESATQLLAEIETS